MGHRGSLNLFVCATLCLSEGTACYLVVVKGVCLFVIVTPRLTL